MYIEIYQFYIPTFSCSLVWKPRYLETFRKNSLGAGGVNRTPKWPFLCKVSPVFAPWIFISVKMRSSVLIIFGVVFLITLLLSFSEADLTVDSLMPRAKRQCCDGCGYGGGIGGGYGYNNGGGQCCDACGQCGGGGYGGGGNGGGGYGSGGYGSGGYGGGTVIITTGGGYGDGTCYSCGKIVFPWPFVRIICPVPRMDLHPTDIAYSPTPSSSSFAPQPSIASSSDSFSSPIPSDCAAFGNSPSFGCFQTQQPAFQTPQLKCRRSNRYTDTPSSGGRRVYSDEDSSRQDSSLLRLTQRFLDLQTKAGILNLNEAAQLLGVQKRRLYDITNVLEGIDLVEKVGKNSIRWKSQNEFFCSSEFQSLNKENAELVECERNLDVLTQSISAALKLSKEDPTDAVYFYSPFSDIRSIDSFTNKTLIAIKAPLEPQPRSSIEVPNPYDTGRYEMTVRNENGGPLLAYLCPDLVDKSATEFAPGNCHTNTAVCEKAEVGKKLFVDPPQMQNVSGLKEGEPNEWCRSPSKQQRMLSPLKMLFSNPQPQPDALSSNSVAGGHFPAPGEAVLSLDPLEDNDPYYLLFMDKQNMSLNSLFSPD
uniref:E2F/DP family winged-helix DNA-binding domain-containing protein n=1 Tax=Globodera rostochiensis TaxID=31243 RepID=A0A914I7R7_GLORO